MTDWTGGYVTDVSYTASFFQDQTPQHLAFICLMNGFAAPAVDRPFTYGELGCGFGVTAGVIAATYPHARVIGIDFNPAHIVEARSMAAAAGLDNATFLERSFAELLDEADGLPPCDMITLHGVYSWIAEADRARIVEILARKLVPGGVCYVSYNALPGWTGGDVLQRLICDVGRSLPDRSDRQFERGVAFVRALRDAGLPQFKDHPILESILKAQEQGLLAYLTHEYMNGNWRPLFHHDVARELAAAKLDYIGSSHAISNFPELNVPAKHEELLQGISQPALRETLKDYFAPRLLRKEVYVRGARRLTRARQDELIRAMRLALTVDRKAATTAMSVPVGEIEVEKRVFEPVFDALADGPKPMSRLLEVADTPEKTGGKAVEIAGLIIGSGQGAAVLPEGAAGPVARCRALNAVLARRAADQPIGRMHAVAAAEIGGGLPTTGLEIRACQALLEGVPEDPEALARFIWEPLAADGEKLLKDGRVLETEDESLATLRNDAAEILARRVPLWRRLGAL